MDQKSNEYRNRYHRFLNTSIARIVEPRDLLPYLRQNNVLDDEEVALIENEQTLCKRQYCFFINILPAKGPAVIEKVYEALRQFTCELTAQEWARCTMLPEESVDGHIEVITHRQSSRTMPPPRPPPPRDVARSVEPQGGAVPPPQRAPPPIGFVTPIPLEPETGVVAPPLPPPAVLGFLRTRYVQTSATPSQPIVTTDSPGLNSFRSIDVDVVEEEVSQVVYTRGVAAPPPDHLGSTGLAARTPESFYDSEPGFRQRQSAVPREAVEEGALNAADIQFGEEIGRGFFARVYIAQFGHRKVAVKKFRDYDEFSLAMFIEEVSIMKNLNHRNVVKFIGFVHSPEDRQLWLVTEYVAGGALRRFCTPTGDKQQVDKSLPIHDKLRIAVDCWAGLDYIHGQNLCHKDISPGNILVSNDLTQIKISDFGLAEFKNLMGTAVTQISGTAMYYPPEFASESGVIRHPTKSDIFSMGASLCELFSEQWYWNINGQARNQFQVMFMLSEQRRLWEEKGEIRYPDCWAKVPDMVQPMLKDAIMPDHKKRKSARELCLASQDLLKNQ